MGGQTKKNVETQNSSEICIFFFLPVSADGKKDRKPFLPHQVSIHEHRRENHFDQT